MNDLKAVRGRSTTKIIFLEQNRRQAPRDGFPDHRRTVDTTADNDKIVSGLQSGKSNAAGVTCFSSANSWQLAVRGQRKVREAYP